MAMTMTMTMTRDIKSCKKKNCTKNLWHSKVVQIIYLDPEECSRYLDLHHWEQLFAAIPYVPKKNYNRTFRIDNFQSSEWIKV